MNHSCLKLKHLTQKKPLKGAEIHLILLTNCNLVNYIFLADNYQPFQEASPGQSQGIPGQQTSPGAYRGGRGAWRGESTPYASQGIGWRPRGGPGMTWRGQGGPRPMFQGPRPQYGSTDGIDGYGNSYEHSPRFRGDL